MWLHFQMTLAETSIVPQFEIYNLMLQLALHHVVTKCDCSFWEMLTCSFCRPHITSKFFQRIHWEAIQKSHIPDVANEPPDKQLAAMNILYIWKDRTKTLQLLKNLKLQHFLSIMVMIVCLVWFYRPDFIVAKTVLPSWSHFGESLSKFSLRKLCASWVNRSC